MEVLVGLGVTESEREHARGVVLAALSSVTDPWEAYTCCTGVRKTRCTRRRVLLRPQLVLDGS